MSRCPLIQLPPKYVLRAAETAKPGADFSAVMRILFPASDSPIFFSDVILADILTSFAKVLGDLWISSCQIWSGGITQGRVKQGGWASYVTLAAVW